LKIGYTSTELPEGKIKYEDAVLKQLEAKDSPKKVTPFYVELIPDEYVQTEAIVIPADSVLDLLILDMEKIEDRLTRVEDDTETVLLKRCLEELENETPLCDLEWTEEEAEILKELSPNSFKPVVQLDGTEDVNTLVTKALDKAGLMFFYTSGPKDFHVNVFVGFH